MNSVYLRSNLQKVNLHKHLVPLEEIEIRNPIYLLGLQGGGLTLLGRMLRRNKSVISCTGNWKRWAGDDETENLYYTELPLPLRGPRHVADDVFGNCDMVYASHLFFDQFHKTWKDVTEEDARAYKRLIKGLLAKYGRAVANPRFLDKSQSYTLEITYLEAVFKEEEPYFLLLLRNPYVWCKRALDTNISRAPWSYEDKLRLACEQFRNSVNTCLEESRDVRHFATFRLEDLVANPRETLRSICSFLELDFCEDMLPSPSHRYHLGAVLDGKWYPLRNPNARYFKEISEKDVEMIERYCGDIVQRFRYFPDG